MPTDPELLRMCTDSTVLDGLRLFLMAGLILSGGMLIVDAWKRGGESAEALNWKREHEKQDPTCPLHKVPRSQCEEKH